MLTIAQLLTPLSGAQFRAQAVTILQTLGLQPQNWPPGGIASSTLTTLCNLLAILSGGQDGTAQTSGLSYAIAQQWNPTASGGGLQLLSKYFYDVTPPQPTFASGNLTLVNSGGGVYTFGAGQATFASTVANSQGVFPTYTNEDPFTLNPSSTLTIPVSCTFAGSGGNSSPGFVSQLVTAMLGVTADNPGPILGIDALSDTQLRQLNIDSLGSRSVFGPRSAYSYAIETATNIVSGTAVNINRWTITIGSHTGDVTIYVCGPDGTTDPNDLAGVAQSIESGKGSTDPKFNGARPDGITVGPSSVTIDGVTIGSPSAATPVVYSPNIVAYILAPKGVLASAMQTTILAALNAYFEGPQNPIGGVTAADDANGSFTGVFESGISGVIAQAVASVTGCVMLSSKFTGNADLALSGNEVATNGVTTQNLVVSLKYTAG